MLYMLKNSDEAYHWKACPAYLPRKRPHKNQVESII